MKTLALIVLLASTSFAAPPKALQYHFEPPAFAADGEGQIFHYFLPATNGFAANINCMAQPWDDTLEAYDKLSRTQFQQMRLQLITAEIVDGILIYEYKGKMQGFDLHWYSRAFKRGDKVYLITATALDERWEEDSPTLIESAKSFTLKEAGVALR